MAIDRIEQQRAIYQARRKRAKHTCRICGRASKVAHDFKLEPIGYISIVVCKDPATCV